MRSLDQRDHAVASSTRLRPRPRAALRRALTAAALALATTGCSISYPLAGSDAEDLTTGSVARRSADSDVAAPVPTGAVSRQALPPPAALAAAPTGSAPAFAARATAAAAPPPGLTPDDWSYARGALGLAMGADATNASVPWANPDTGAYGAFTAAAAPVVENGATCRPFAASHSASGREQRLEGTACRTAAGHWEAVAIRTAASRTL